MINLESWTLVPKIAVGCPCVIWNKEHSLLFNLGVNKALLAFVISSLLSLGVTKIQIYRSFYNSRF